MNILRVLSENVEAISFVSFQVMTENVNEVTSGDQLSVGKFFPLTKGFRIGSIMRPTMLYLSKGIS